MYAVEVNIYKLNSSCTDRIQEMTLTSRNRDYYSDVFGSLKPKATNLPQSQTGARTATAYSCTHTMASENSSHLSSQ